MANNIVYKIFVEKVGGRDVVDYVGLPGELFYDPGRGQLRLSDGSNPGGTNTSSSAEATDNVARAAANSAFDKANIVVQTAFTTINVAGQPNIVAESNVDFITFVAGSGIDITTDPSNNEITISSIAPDMYARAHAEASFDLANSRAQNVYTTVTVQDKGTVTATTNASGFILSPGAGISMSGSDNTITIRSTTNTFSTIAVASQNNVVADSNVDTLTLVAGNGITITTNSTTDSITIEASNTVDQVSRDAANGAFVALNVQSVIVDHKATGIPAADVGGSQIVQTVTVPGGIVGANGWVEVRSIWTMGGTANAKGLNIRTGGASGTRITSYSATNHIVLYLVGTIHNRGNVQSQISTSPQQFYYGAVTSDGPQVHTVNTNSDWDIYFTVTKTTTTDPVTLESYTVIANYRE